MRSAQHGPVSGRRADRRLRRRQQPARLHQQPAGTLRGSGKLQRDRRVQQVRRSGRGHLLQRELHGFSGRREQAVRCPAGGENLQSPGSDTLWAIAQKNDLTFKELSALNTNFKGAPLTETSNIQEGDELIVTKQEATLEVRITKVETRQEEIPYSTETTESKDLNKGVTRTTQEGENGPAERDDAGMSTTPTAPCWNRRSFPPRPSRSR